MSTVSTCDTATKPMVEASTRADVWNWEEHSGWRAGWAAEIMGVDRHIQEKRGDRKGAPGKSTLSRKET